MPPSGSSRTMHAGLGLGKGSKERTIFWDSETQSALRAYLEARTDPYPPVFIRLDNHRGQPGPLGESWRLSPQSCWGIVTRYSQLTGIPATPHMFRHAMASAMLNNGAPLSLIQDLLGHANVNTTKKVYAATSSAHCKGVRAVQPDR
jgi:site-specific recombinase XerD